MAGILNVYVWEIASEALRGKSPMARQDLLHFTQGWNPALHYFYQKKEKKCTWMIYQRGCDVKAADRTWRKPNYLHLFPSAFLFFPPFMHTDRKRSRRTACEKTDESCFNKGCMVIKCQIRPFRTAKTVPGKYPDQLKINQVRQNNKNPNWLV